MDGTKSADKVAKADEVALTNTINMSTRDEGEVGALSDKVGSLNLDYQRASLGGGAGILTIKYFQVLTGKVKL